MFYLYLKTHNTTGIKYLGKTEKDPYIYTGSGTYWKKHLHKHGNNVKTEILLATDSLEELSETGLFFSTIWNIVESDKWANQISECGTGYTSEISKSIQKKYTNQGTHNFQINRCGVDKEGNIHWISNDEFAVGDFVDHNSKEGYRRRGISENSRKNLPPKMKSEWLKNTKVTATGAERTEAQKKSAKLHSERMKGRSGNQRGLKRSEETLQKLRAPKPYLMKPKEQVKCPHCGKVGGKPVMAKWHFDKCKLINVL